MRPSPSNVFKFCYQGIKYRVRRTQFAMVPANVVIVYGAQGESYDTAIADLGVPPSQDEHLFWLAMYVMLTRCKTLEGLLLLRLSSKKAFQAGAPEYVKHEMARLAKLHTCTMQRLHVNLTEALGALPPQVADLFAEAAGEDDSVDWDSLASLLRDAISAREAAAGFVPRRRLSTKTARCNADVSAPSRRGPNKRYAT